MVDEDVDAALARLVAAGTLDPEQADAVRREVDAAAPAGLPPRTIGRILAEIGGYVGACFVIAAIAVFTGSHWDELATWARALVFAGPAGLLIATALVLRHLGGGSPVTDRLAAAQLLLAGGLLGGVTYVLLPPDTSWDGGWTWTVVWGVVTLAWAAGYAIMRGGLLHVATLIGLVSAVALGVDHLTHHDWDEVNSWLDLSVGGSIVAVATLWAALSGLRALRERALGLTVAGVVAFVGAYHLTASWSYEHSWPGYVATGLLAALGLAGYLRTRIVGLLVVGVVSLAVVVPEVVLDYTDGALGTAGGLLVAGLSIVAASALGFRLRHEVTARD